MSTSSLFCLIKTSAGFGLSLQLELIANPQAPAFYIASTSPIEAPIYMSVPRISVDSQILPQIIEVCFGRLGLVMLIIQWCEPQRAGLMRWLKPVSVPTKCLRGVLLVPVTLHNSTEESATIYLPGSIDTFISLLYLLENQSLTFRTSSNSYEGSDIVYESLQATPRPPPILISVASSKRWRMSNVYFMVSRKIFQ